MKEIQKTAAFSKWFNALKDRRAKVRIQVRIDRLELGHYGDAEPVGDGVSELRIFYGPGYRVYFVERGSVIVILLLGGAINPLSRWTSPKLKILPRVLRSSS